MRKFCKALTKILLYASIVFDGLWILYKMHIFFAGVTVGLFEGARTVYGFEAFSNDILGFFFLDPIMLAGTIYQIIYFIVWLSGRNKKVGKIFKAPAKIILYTFVGFDMIYFFRKIYIFFNGVDIGFDETCMVYGFKAFKYDVIGYEMLDPILYIGLAYQIIYFIMWLYKRKGQKDK